MQGLENWPGLVGMAFAKARCTCNCQTAAQKIVVLHEDGCFEHSDDGRDQEEAAMPVAGACCHILRRTLTSFSKPGNSSRYGATAVAES